MSVIKAHDKCMGDLHEDLVKDFYESKYGITLVKTPEDHPMDFESNGCFYEVKSRNCFSHTYPTTMIGTNKLNFARGSRRKVFFIFCFKDGIFCYEFNKDHIFPSKEGGRNDRGEPEYRNYSYILMEYLKKLD